MNEARTQQEPSMEEILASIRRIISEDADKDGDIDVEAAPQEPGDEEPAEAAEAAPAPESAAEPEPAMAEPEPAAVEPEPAAVEEEEVLELTNVLEEAAPEPEPEPQPPPRVEAAPRPAFGRRDRDEDSDRLVSDDTADATREAFARLIRESAGEEPPADRGRHMGDGSQTIEEVVRSELRPLLREWLDRHLRDVVDEIVRREVEHIVRGLGRR